MDTYAELDAWVAAIPEHVRLRTLEHSLSLIDFRRMLRDLARVYLAE